VGGKILGYQHLAVATVAPKGAEKSDRFLNYNVLEFMNIRNIFL
jgi:hypothetical protein